MSTGTIEHVKQDTIAAVRNLPDAHAPWQFSWRNARFRSAIGRIDSAMYALDVEGLTDKQLALLEEAAVLVIKLIEIHVSNLGTAVRDAVDRAYFGNIIVRLRDAAEGLAQGIAPNPAKRPSDDELMERFAAGLRRSKIA